MGMAAILVMWPGPFEQMFVPPSPKKLSMKFDFDYPSGSWGENV